jgi:hypothetical protein
MLQTLEKAFPEMMQSAKNKSLLNARVPSYRKEPTAALFKENLE